MKMKEINGPQKFDHVFLLLFWIGLLFLGVALKLNLVSQKSRSTNLAAEIHHSGFPLFHSCHLILFKNE